MHYLCVIFDWLMSHHFSNVYPCLLNYVLGRGCPVILSVMTGSQLKIVTCFNFSFLILQSLFLILMIIIYPSSHGFKMGDVYFLISLAKAFLRVGLTSYLTKTQATGKESAISNICQFIRQGPCQSRLPMARSRSQSSVRSHMSKGWLT